jgi:probable phosphoglycerate mutase
MTFLCIARHGETDWNAAGILQGWIDVPLNATGRQQSVEMAQVLAACGFARIWSSPLVRALDTARAIAAQLGLSAPACHDGLKERNFGVFQGIPKVELAELNPVLCQQILKRNPAATFEEGETMDEFADRVLGALADIATAHAGERALIVTHGWVMDAITRHVSGLPRTAILPKKPKNMECLWLAADAGTLAAIPPPPCAVVG